MLPDIALQEVPLILDSRVRMDCEDDAIENLTSREGQVADTRTVEKDTRGE